MRGERVGLSTNVSSAGGEASGECGAGDPTQVLCGGTGVGTDGRGWPSLMSPAPGENGQVILRQGDGTG